MFESTKQHRKKTQYEKNTSWRLFSIGLFEKSVVRQFNRGRNKQDALTIASADRSCRINESAFLTVKVQMSQGHN